MTKRTIKVETFGDPTAYFARVPAAIVHELDIRSSMRASKMSDDGKYMFLGMDPNSNPPQSVTRRAIQDADVSDFRIFEFACAEHDIDLEVQHIEVGADPQGSLEEFQRLYVAGVAAREGLGLDLEAAKERASDIFKEHFDPERHAVQEMADLFLPGDQVTFLVKDEVVVGEIAAIKPDQFDEMIEVSVSGHGNVPLTSKALLESITAAQGAEQDITLDPF